MLSRSSAPKRSGKPPSDPFEAAHLIFAQLTGERRRSRQAAGIGLPATKVAGMVLMTYYSPFLVNLALTGLVAEVLLTWLLWRTLDRVGLVGAMALLTFVPLGFFIVMAILAFSPWPNVPDVRPPRPVDRTGWR